VVDDDAVAPLANGFAVEDAEERVRVALPRPRRVCDRADLGERHPPDLLPRVVALDLALETRRDRDPGALEDADLDRLRVDLRRADVERGVEVLRVQPVLADRRGQRA